MQFKTRNGTLFISGRRPPSLFLWEVAYLNSYDGFAKYQMLTTTDAHTVSVYHSMPKTVEPEITEPTTWINQLFIPFALFEKHIGNLGDVSGQTWHANFYKCGDKTSHPHWASWNPVSELNFHLPKCFGTLKFA